MSLDPVILLLRRASTTVDVGNGCGLVIHCNYTVERKIFEGIFRCFRGLTIFHKMLRRRYTRSLNSAKCIARASTTVRGCGLVIIFTK